MKMTEKEAAGKWCPHVRIAVLAGHGGAACNKHPDADIDAHCRCAGSRCAMWRWADSPSCRRIRLCDQLHATTEPERPSSMPTSWVFEPWAPAHPDGWAQWIEPEEEAHARRRGYCGLAGKPEDH